jgi:nitrate reductase gamma subunit
MSEGDVVEFWIQFGRGPLFAAAFALMVLGLARIVALTLIGIVEAYRRNSDRIVNWKEVARQSTHWMVPVARLWKSRPAYSTLSVLFHMGLLAVPLFAAAHVLLWRRAVGFAWRAMPQGMADVLTITALVAGAGLVIGRVGSPAARSISRPQEYFWPVLLLIPFATGFACTHAALSPKAYQALMLLHVYAADLIMALIPFTKIAHCVLAPLSQIVTAVAWKFPAGAGERVAATLGYADCPSWMPKARLGITAHTAVPAAPPKTQIEVKAAKQEVTAQ